MVPRTRDQPVKIESLRQTRRMSFSELSVDLLGEPWTGSMSRAPDGQDELQGFLINTSDRSDVLQPMTDPACEPDAVVLQ